MLTFFRLLFLTAAIVEVKMVCGHLQAAWNNCHDGDELTFLGQNQFFFLALILSLHSDSNRKVCTSAFLVVRICCLSKRLTANWVTFQNECVKAGAPLVAWNNNDTMWGLTCHLKRWRPLLLTDRPPCHSLWLPSQQLTGAAQSSGGCRLLKIPKTKALLCFESLTTQKS